MLDRVLCDIYVPYFIQDTLTVLNLAQMAHSRCLTPMWVMHVLCLGTIATAATPHSLQAEDILRAQDGLALRGDMMSHDRGISGIDDRIDAPESQDAQIQLEMSSMPLRKPLLADQLAVKQAQVSTTCAGNQASYMKH